MKKQNSGHEEVAPRFRDSAEYIQNATFGDDDNVNPALDVGRGQSIKQATGLDNFSRSWGPQNSLRGSKPFGGSTKNSGLTPLPKRFDENAPDNSDGDIPGPVRGGGY
jgi:hypothetical protein